MMSNNLGLNNSSNNNNMPNSGNTSTVDVDNIIKRLLDGKEIKKILLGLLTKYIFILYCQ